jgi:hypothetical protein
VGYLDTVLSAPRYQNGVPALSSRDLAAYGHALHALMVYDARVFKPADDDKPIEEKKPAEESKPAATSAALPTAER